MRVFLARPCAVKTSVDQWFGLSKTECIRNVIEQPTKRRNDCSRVPEFQSTTEMKLKGNGNYQ